MKPVVNVALVGCGYWGPNLARNFHQLEMSRLVACCDLDREKTRRLERLYPGMRTTTSVDDILNDPGVDAVAIATPARTHYALAKAALESGKHVLVEKPLTMDSGQALDLHRMAEERRLVLMVGHVFEYNPAVRAIKRFVESGEIGEVYYAYSTRVNLGRVQSDINALWSIAPHDISILLYLLGQMPEEVQAAGARYLNDSVEDVVFVNLRFPSGVLAHVHASWLDPSKVRQMTIVGSRKMIVYDDVAAEKIRLYDKGVYRKGEPIYGEFQYKLHSGDILIPKIQMSEPLKVECAHFLECIVEGKRPLTDGMNGWRVVRVLEAADRSLQRGGEPVTLEF
jgi:predicted dehydrogenase